MNYVSAKEAKAFLHINPTTLKAYKDQGLIKYKQLSSRKFLYDIDSFNVKDSEYINRKHVIYARVSNTKQKNDLDNQIEMIKNYCISNGIIVDNVYKDIASGMNEKRAEFNILLDEVINNKVDTVYITFKDILTRFGFEYFETIFSKYNTKIKVLDNFEESNKNFQDELTDDLISIIHHFSMKLYSNRRKKFKEIQKILNTEENNEDK